MTEKDPVAAALDRLAGKQSYDLAGNPIEQNLVKPGDGFLWKPKGENSGKLVVLLPPSYSGKVRSVALKDKNGRQLEAGRSSGVANGGREHFRFSQPGGSYPNGVLVEVELSSGKKLAYKIDSPSSRVQ